MVPDGVLPWWLSAGGALLAVLLVASAVRVAAREAHRRRVAPMGVMAALMVVIMSVEIVPLGYEFHGTVLAGVVIGPWLAPISALLFNLFRAILGDGALTNVGVNTCITWTEMAGGWLGFALLQRIVRAGRVSLAGGVATVVGLGAGTILYLIVVALAGTDVASFGHVGTFVTDTADFGSIFAISLPGSETDQPSLPGPILPFTTFASLTLFAGAIGWTLEGLVTGLTLAFIVRVRPSLLAEGWVRW